MIIQSIDSAIRQNKRERKQVQVGYRYGGEPYIINTAKVEKAKQYQANMARGKMNKQADNLRKIQADPFHNENYLKLKQVVKTYNMMREMKRIEDADQRLRFVNLMKSIEFVAVKMDESFSQWYSPLSPKQMVYVEKAIALINENCDLLI